MTQLLHIFKKDLRRLWPLALLSLVMVALHASHRWLLLNHLINAQPNVVMGTEFFALLTPLFWCVFLVFLIHQEPLCGDRQFWITRPYSRWSLLAAKLLFVFLAIQIPVLLSDIFLLWQTPSALTVTSLLVRNLYMSIVVLLPVATAAMVTSGLGQVIAAGLACLAGMVIWANYFMMFGLGRYEGLEWMLSTTAALLLLAAGGAVAFLQYGFRKAAPARAILVAAGLTLAVAAHLFPWSNALSLQAALTGGGPRPEIQISPHPAGLKSTAQRRGTHGWNEFVELHLPVRIAGLPQSTELVSDGVQLRVDAPGGQYWEFGPTSNMSLLRAGENAWVRLHLDTRFYHRFRSTPVSFHIAMDATLFKNQHTTTVPTGKDAQVPGAGNCASGLSHRMGMLMAVCVQPAWTTGRVQIQWSDASPKEELRSRGPYLSLPIITALNPLSNWAAFHKEPATEIVYTVQQPVAHIRRDWKMENVRMENFRIP